MNETAQNKATERLQVIVPSEIKEAAERKAYHERKKITAIVIEALSEYLADEINAIRSGEQR